MLGRHAPRASFLLDIGCGRGAATTFIAREIGAAKAGGVDISERSATVARQAGIDAYAIDLDSEPLPFSDASADAVHCGEVIEHVVDTDHLADEIRRVLTPGGVCVLSTPNLAAWYNRIGLLLGYQPFLSQVSFRYGAGRPRLAPAEGGGHLRMFTHRALLEFLALHGFELIDQCGATIFELGQPPGSAVAKRLIAPLDSFLTRFPSLACDMIVAFRRR